MSSLPCLVVTASDVNAYDEIALLLILAHFLIYHVADVGIGTKDGQQNLLHVCPGASTKIRMGGGKFKNHKVIFLNVILSWRK